MGSSSILWTEALLSASRGTRCARISRRPPCSPPPTLQHLIPRSPWRWRFILPGTSFPGRAEASEWPARDSCRTGAPQGWASQQGWAWAGELGSPPAAARPAARYSFGLQRRHAVVRFILSRYYSEFPLWIWGSGLLLGIPPLPSLSGQVSKVAREREKGEALGNSGALAISQPNP